MMRILCLTAAVGVAVAAAPADEKVTIKLRPFQKGDVLQVSVDESEGTTSRVESTTGMLLKEDKKQQAKVAVYKETILERPKASQQPTRLKREYEKAQITENGKERKLPYDGKAVLIEKKGKKYEFRIEGGEALTGDDAKQLDEEFNKDKPTNEEIEMLLLPKESVAVGGSWQIDVPAFLKAVLRGEQAEAMTWDDKKAKGTGKLVKAYKKDGKQYGVMAFTLDVPLKEINAGGQKMELESGAKMTLRIEMDACIDGSDSSRSFNGGMNMELSATIKDAGGTPQAKLAIKADTKGRETHKQLPGK